MTAPEKPAETFPIPRGLLADGDLFMMQVPDDSMHGHGIRQDSWLIVQRLDDAGRSAADADAAAGEKEVIVVARAGEQDLVRFLIQAGSERMLFAASVSIRPFSADTAVITGRVIAVLRQF